MTSADTPMMTSNRKIFIVCVDYFLSFNFLVFSVSIFAGKAMVPTPARGTLGVLSLLRRMDGMDKDQIYFPFIYHYK